MRVSIPRSLRPLALAFAWLIPIVSVAPATSAERVSLSYSFFEQSIPIPLLEPYVRTGKLNPDLAAYVQQLNSKQLVQLRQFLSTRIPLNAVAVSQFLYTPTGEQLLQQLGRIIETDGRISGFYALRAGMIQAAANPQGFTLLDVLKKFPSRNVRVDLSRVLAIVDDAKQLGTETESAIALINQESQKEATIPTVPLPQDVQQPGIVRWQKQSILVRGRSRDRQIPTDLYLPIFKARHPVVIISHGLGSNRMTFAYLAQHLASHGFAVAVPEHPGSSSSHIAALLSAKATQVIRPQELLDRPLDVKDLLNQLEQLSASDSDFRGLDLQNVGIIGQSLGGYTALAVAGAKIQAEHLQSVCQTSQDSLNFSLLLQCLALQVPQFPATVSDPRIKATIAINPMVSGIFGQTGLSQIKVPTMLVAGSADTLAPALPEQIQPFTWLTTRHKYLALIQGGTHFSTIAGSPEDVIPLPASVGGANSALARQYINSLSTAFFQTYLARNQDYRSYLSTTYTNSISQASLPLKLIQTLSNRDERAMVSLVTRSNIGSATTRSNDPQR